MRGRRLLGSAVAAAAVLATGTVAGFAVASGHAKTHLLDTTTVIIVGGGSSSSSSSSSGGGGGGGQQQQQQQQQQHGQNGDEVTVVRGGVARTITRISQLHLFIVKRVSGGAAVSATGPASQHVCTQNACVYGFRTGVRVLLRASGFGNSPLLFERWAGSVDPSCVTSPNCFVRMGGGRTVSAIFGPAPVPLTTATTATTTATTTITNTTTITTTTTTPAPLTVKKGKATVTKTASGWDVLVSFTPSRAATATACVYVNGTCVHTFNAAQVPAANVTLKLAVPSSVGSGAKQIRVVFNANGAQHTTTWDVTLP
jgi:hypothetical protein